MLDLVLAAVDDEADAGNGDGGLGYVGGDDDLAGSWWGGEEDALLSGLRERREERERQDLGPLLVI